jgi:glutathione S-transferase
MAASRRVTFFHAPQSRSAGVRVLMEELDADHDLQVLDLQAGDSRQPAYLAINPMGKVPALLHGGALVTEQAAVYMYLADLYPEARLAPPIGDALRGPYLRWMVFYGSCFEPALIDRSLQRGTAAASTSPYGDFDTTLRTLDDQLARGPWMLGERHSALDVLWGSALAWTTMFKLVPETPSIAAYVARYQARAATQRASAADALLVKAQQAARGG